VDDELDSLSSGDNLELFECTVSRGVYLDIDEYLFDVIYDAMIEYYEDALNHRQYNPF
jgi:hypothetical protein